MRENRPAALDDRAREVLGVNDRGHYTVPNPEVYPFQWNWDSAFVALGFATFDLERAWREIESLFDAQWDDGFLPHISFWKDDPGYFPGPAIWQAGQNPPTSGITQPPVAASVVRHLFRADPKVGRPRVESLFPKLLAWHDWFHEFRDPLHNGLALVVHPWETGRDNSPEWDAPATAIDTSHVEPYQRRDIEKLDHGMRPTRQDYDRYVALLQFGRAHDWDHRVLADDGPFRVIDVGMTLILLRANRDLLSLAELLGRKREADVLRARISRAEDGVRFLWNPEARAFCSYDLIAGRSLPLVTSASFLVFYAGVGNTGQRRAALGHLRRMAGKVRYLVPSFDPEHVAFDRMRYWRGPVWAVVNYCIAEGLSRSGHPRWAKRIARDTADLIRRSGFHEAFCPLSGDGTGGRNFSWTAAMWLHWARQAAAREGETGA